jgi:6-phosphogluconolactonase
VSFTGRIDIAEDSGALVRRAAEWMTAIATQSRASVRIALSGGSTPRPLYQLLASTEFIQRFPWQRVLWFWGDERFVPHDDPESNYRMAWEALLSRAPVPPQNVFSIPTGGTPQDAAQQYERVLQDQYGNPMLDPALPLFDIVLLGVGEDGHTASLLPGEPVLEERRRWVAAVAHGRPEARITLTFPAIESSRHVAFLIAGQGKAAIFRAIRSGNSGVPAARVHPVGDIVWFVDRAAAGDWKQGTV